MNINEQIKFNKFGQDLLTFQQVIGDFTSLKNEQKRKYLNDLAFLIIQSKANDSDIDEAIELGHLKLTFTPCVKIKKGIKWNILEELINLPDYELDKVAILFLSLYKIAYKRLLEKEKDDPNKWWFQDLSNENLVDRIRTLSNLRLVLRKIYNEKGKEIG